MFWCCCGQPTGIQCDSYISGYDDEFTTLQESTGDGGWLYTVPVGLTPTIQPVGTLVLDYDPVMVGTPITFTRCAQWNNFISLIRYTLSCNWTSIGYEEADGLMTGASIDATFTNAGTPRTVTMEHRLRWEGGVGWRHQLTLFPNTLQETSVFVGATIQAARTPAPQGPFAVTLGIQMARQITGQWQAIALWNGQQAGSAVGIAAPQSTESEFSHGFSFGFSVVDARIDRWRYEVER